MAKTQMSPMLKRVVSHIFTKPATTMFPREEPQISGSFRGQPVFDCKLCVGCGLCSKECPSKAIEMVEVGGKKNPQFRLDRCLFCYNCAETCPRKAIKSSTYFELATTDKSSLIYQAYNECLR